MKEIVYKLDHISKTVRQLIHNLPSKVVCFHGEMGAGKTTLIKALVKELGGADGGTSPTFGIVNEYSSDHGQLLAYHFDFYRLNDETEALDLGLEDYLDFKGWIFMEWPEKIKSYIPENAVHITLEIMDHKTRKLLF